MRGSPRAGNTGQQSFRRVRAAPPVTGAISLERSKEWITR